MYVFFRPKRVSLCIEPNTIAEALFRPADSFLWVSYRGFRGSTQNERKKYWFNPTIQTGDVWVLPACAG